MDIIRELSEDGQTLTTINNDTGEVIDLDFPEYCN